MHLKNLICVYKIYVSDSSNLLLNDLNNIIGQLPKLFKFLDNFNSRNLIWRSDYTDVTEKIVKQFLDYST